MIQDLWTPAWTAPPVCQLVTCLWRTSFRNDCPRRPLPPVPLGFLVLINIGICSYSALSYSLLSYASISLSLSLAAVNVHHAVIIHHIVIYVIISTFCPHYGATRNIAEHWASSPWNIRWPPPRRNQEQQEHRHQQRINHWLIQQHLHHRWLQQDHLQEATGNSLDEDNKCQSKQRQKLTQTNQYLLGSKQWKWHWRMPSQSQQQHVRILRRSDRNNHYSSPSFTTLKNQTTKR